MPRIPPAPQTRGIRERPSHHESSNDNGGSSFDESNFDRCFEDLVATTYLRTFLCWKYGL